MTAALRRLPAAQGIAAMQSINVTAPMPPLMLLLFGTALACVALIAAVVEGRRGCSSAPRSTCVGVIAVTMAYNVPRNNELAALDPDSAAAAARWPSWMAEWTAGNHVRTVSGVAAAVLLLQAPL